ncbi:MAG: NADH-quinone oxidoreductase subunit A [SAR202 cluster bacterium]|nr:NADH-quinone oxidoreductase subunit A [SAR202 cluster bacterium]
MPGDGFALDWVTVAVTIVVGFAAMGAAFLANAVLAPRRPSVDKATPYESGIRPGPLGWSQFNARYYLFAILFLIFDVEAVFLFPWALVFLQTASYVFYAMLLFIGILFFGVLYAWRKGVLEWR